jgi:hypothetical protein
MHYKIVRQDAFKKVYGYYFHDCRSRERLGRVDSAETIVEKREDVKNSVLPRWRSAAINRAIFNYCKKGHINLHNHHAAFIHQSKIMYIC